MRLSKTLLILGPLAICPLGCSDLATPAEVGNQVRITVSPLTLDNITDACYSLSTYAAEVSALTPANYPADDLVWERTPVCASDFGIGAGATGDVSTSGITYIGACDASVDTNDVVLILENLYQGGESPTSQAGGSGLPVPAADFYNPCTAAEPCVLTKPCLPSEDVNVTFDITVMRDSNKGFFDIGVQFEDIFCSAKFDCGYSDGTPIEKVYGLDGELHPTAVLAFTCTAGTDAASHLYLTDIQIECDDVDQTISPANSGLLFDAPHALPLGAAFPDDAVFQAVTSFGQVDNTDFTEYYWTVALGFDITRANNCTLTARASATEGTFDDTTLGSGLTPEDATWPVIEFNIPIGKTGTAPNERLTCAENDGFQNKLNATDSGVITDYTAVNVRRCFDLAYPGNPALIGSVDDAADPTTCTGDVDVACVGFPSSYGGGQIVIQDGAQVSPNPSTTPLELSCLQNVSGRLILVGSFPSIPANTFAKLETLGGLTFSSVSGNADFNFPKLTAIQANGLAIQGEMGSVSLPVIATLNGGVQVQQTTIANGLTLGQVTSLQSLNIATSAIGGVGVQLPALATVTGNANFSNNGALAAIGLPALTSVTAPSAFIYQNNTVGVASLSLPAYQLGRVIVSGNPALTSLSLPALTSASDIRVSGHTNLTTLAAPLLTSVTTDFSVYDNTLLTCATVQALLAQVSPAPSITNIANNGGTCPPAAPPACPLCVTVGNGCSSTDDGLSFPLQQCNQFTQCLNEFFVGTFSCPGNLLFNPTSRVCDWAGSQAPGCTLP